MQRRKMALIAVLTLVISMAASLQVVDLVSANYYPPPSIEIFSPVSASVYRESSVQLYVRVNALLDESSAIRYVRYCLDGKANITLTDLAREDRLYYWTSQKGVIATGNGFIVNTTIDNLSEGKHTLIVYSHAADGKEMSRSIEFTVDYDYVPPQTGSSGFNNFNSTLPPLTPTPTPSVTGTETPQSAANADKIQPFDTSLLVIVAVSVGVFLLIAGLMFSRKINRVKLEGRTN